ncbi:MAG TPA: hypothetical protein VM784_11780 [Actinomycetota bacterium]|nr:hypothetical protein [Actinomycetota bacterium]
MAAEPEDGEGGVRKSLLRRRSFDAYKWSALSFVEGRHRLCDRSNGCADWAPDLRRGKRYLRHDI